jgi:DNA-binding transcriptional LysR family regulator
LGIDSASLSDLHLFAAAFEAGNLSDVARDLGCTQPAVSQRIRRLERNVGAPLLVRHRKGVAPSEAGRLLYDAIVEGVGTLRAAAHQIEQLAKGDAGSVRITTGGTAVKHLLGGAIARFRKDHPVASLELESANSTRRCLEALRKEEADLAWITMGTDAGGIEQRPALTMPWTLVGPAADPRMKRAKISLADLRGIRYIPLREQAISQTQLSAAFERAGLVLDARASVDDWDTAVLLVELGLGYTLVPAIHGWNFAREGRVRAVPIEGLHGVTFGWAARRWRSLSPLVLDFVKTLATEMSRLKGVSGLRVIG